MINSAFFQDPVTGYTKQVKNENMKLDRATAHFTKFFVILGHASSEKGLDHF